jgi:large subunit ribosomal protein L10
VENPRPEKVAVVDEVRERLSSAQAAVLTDYRGMNVSALAQLRRNLRQAGGDYKIYKNTLVRFAARDLGLEIDELLTGPTAIAFVQGDAAAVAKALRDYGRTNPALVLKGGVLGQRVIGAGEVQALADLPSRDQLMAQIAGLFEAPLRQMAGLLDAVPRTFAYALQALIDKSGGDAAEPTPETEQ